jgi:hypothetical protein
MTPLEDAVGPEFAARLRPFNIRVAEQFVSLAETPKGVEGLAHALGIPVDQLEALVEEVRRNHMGGARFARSGTRYCTGLRTRR